MSKESTRQAPRRWLKWSVRAIVCSVLLLLLLALFPIDLPFEFLGLLLFGWVSYLRNVLPRAVFNPEIALEALFALTLAVFGLHRVLRWWARNRNDSTTNWRVNWTIKITMGILLLFATSSHSICMRLAIDLQAVAYSYRYLVCSIGRRNAGLRSQEVDGSHPQVR